jgi:cytochrome b561
MLKNTPESWGALSKGFHWSVGVLVLCMLPLGFYMVGLPPSPSKAGIVMLHKSIGALILALVLPRILWRLCAGRPLPLATHEEWERRLAEIVHFLLYAAILTMVFSGWIMTAAGEYSFRVFGLFNMPAIVSRNPPLSDLMRTVHNTACYAVLGLVFLHFAGAVKHHIIDKDRTLLRMVPNVAPKLLALAVAAAGALSVALCAWFILQPKPERPAKPPAMQAENAMPQQAAAAPGTETAAPAAAAQAWSIDVPASTVGFTATVDGQPFTGRFEQMSGTIDFDDAHLADSRIDVSVNIASVKSGSAERDQSIVSADWFDASAIPAARFTSSSIVKTGEGAYKATGDLTLRDTVKQVELPFTLAITQGADGRKTAVAKGGFTISRGDYRIGQGDWASSDTVADKVDINLEIHATAQ